MAFFDIKVVSPYAKSYASMSSEALYLNAEKAKGREYAERIRNVEHADFNPLVFTTAGGMGPQCQLVVKRLAATLSAKKDIPNSVVAGWLRCRLSLRYCALRCYVSAALAHAELTLTLISS